MTLIPQITAQQALSALVAGKELPSVELLNGKGEYCGTFLNPPKDGGMTIFDEIRINAEYLGVRSNSVLHPSVIEGINQLDTPVANSLTCACGFSAKSDFGLAVHKRKHNATV